MRKYLLNRSFVLIMASWMAVISIPPSNAFAFPTSSIVVSDIGSRQAQIEKIMNVLSDPRAQMHLKLMKLESTDVRRSLERLDDAQLAQVSQRADSVKAAGDGALGVVIAILVIVLLIVLIVNINHKKVVIQDQK